MKDSPTFWQYKAVEENTITDNDLKTEVNKWYATELIGKSYALRFCVCDSIADYKRSEWECLLNNEIHQINPTAPKARVLTSDDIANWANGHLDIILRFFRSYLSTDCRHIVSWGKAITKSTPKYVQIEDWDALKQKIHDHVDFAKSSPSVILPIFGESGVGKTRLVYEALSSDPTIRNQIVYTDDENGALKIARLLANEEHTYAILVADECSGATRMKIQEITQSITSRVRIVTIDNAWDRPRGQDPEPVLSRMSDNDAEKILAQNYPRIPDERRRAYAQYSNGFIRFAADLCEHDALIARSGSIDSVLGNIWDYLKKTLREDEMQTLQALSLLKNVGMKDDVANQLRDLCAVTRLDPDEVRRQADRINQGSGFVAKAGRYCYVTPEIIAKLGFDMAWKAWAADDPQMFLSNFPQSLLESFNQRIASSAKEEVRRIVGDFFRDWATSNTVNLLASLDVTERLVTLVETDTDSYLPLLKRIIENATDEDLVKITSKSVNGRWGPRRPLVWLMERLAAFTESFSHAEFILLRLALAESEPGIGNNATNQWKQLYRITLSGTAIPFEIRLKLLQDRLLSEDDRIAMLALNAISQCFDHNITRMQVPTVVGGRITPPEWKPATYPEWGNCQKLALSVLRELLLNPSIADKRKDRIREIIIQHLRSLLAAEHLDVVQTMFDMGHISGAVQVRLYEKIEEFLHFEVERKDDKSKPPVKYIDGVRAWYESIVPKDLHGLLVFWVGKDPWHHSLLEKEKTWEAELNKIANEFLSKPDLFLNDIEWLCSPDARSSTNYGLVLGKLDSKMLFLSQIVHASLRYKSVGLSKGYIRGLLTSYPECSGQVNQLIDKVQSENPEIAYELFIVGGDLTRSLTRTIELIDSLRLPVTALRAFAYGIDNRDLTNEECKIILARFIRAIDAEDWSSGKVAIEFLGFQAKVEEKSQQGSILANSEIREMVWKILTKTAPYGGDNYYWWGKIMVQLASHDPDRAIRIVANGLLSEDIGLARETENLLVELGKVYPAPTMKYIGETMDDEKRGWVFFIYNLKHVIAALPPDIVIEWSKNVDIKKVQKLARHLPTPYIDETGTPIVPVLTEYVLRTYEQDERTFNEFGAGIHSSQIYWGDIAAQHEKEAENARKFLDHPLRRIRQWAELEIKSAKREAEWSRQRDEEFNIG